MTSADSGRRMADIARLVNPLADVEREVMQERADSLAAQGRKLAADLEALRTLDATNSASKNPALRRELVATAGATLWRFVIQREACGLRDTERMMREYRVPPDVRLRMGVMPNNGGQTEQS